MERRDFLQASLAGVCTVAAAGSVLAADAKPQARDLYELRTYSLVASQQKTLDTYLSKALLPTLKRFGYGPTGVFVEKATTGEQLKVHVLLVHPTAEACVTLSTRLATDDEHRKLGDEYWSAKAAAPCYARIESSLLGAIEGMPRLGKTDPSKSRLFNLRIYESHNERAGKKKIEMFNKGELDIFQRVGLTPVFFAEALTGTALPNLTYLLVFPDEPGRLKAWDTFRADPAWLKLKALPEYADKEIVSKITNKLLTPAEYSEV